MSRPLSDGRASLADRRAIRVGPNAEVVPPAPVRAQTDGVNQRLDSMAGATTGRLGIEEVAAVLGVGRRTIFRLLEKGVLPVAGRRTRGRKLWFDRADVTAVLGVIAAGYSVRQLEVAKVLARAIQVLETCVDVARVAGAGRDRVLDQLELLYMVTSDQRIRAELRRFGRSVSR